MADLACRMLFDRLNSRSRLAAGIRNQQLNHNNQEMKHTKTVGALAAATVLTTGYALAGEPAPAPMIEPEPESDFFEGEVHVGYNSMYEFRFVDLGQDMVEAGADIGFNLGGGWGVSAGAWYASTNDSKPWGRGAGSSNELDLYAAVSYGFEWLTVEAGYIYYYFPDQVFNGVNWETADTQELYISVGTDFFEDQPWEFGVEATWFYDFDSNDGSYWDVHVTKPFKFTECIGLELTAGVGFADGHGLQLDGSVARWSGYYGASLDGYQGWYVAASLPWQIVENVTLTPYIKYTDGASDLLTNVTDITTGQDYLFAGANLTVSF